MSIAVKCAQCQATLKVRDEFAGKRGKCPQCGAALAVPAKAVAGEPVARTAPPAEPAAPRPLPAAQPLPGPSAVRSAAAAPAPAPAIDRAALGKEILDSFQGDLPRPRPAPMYRLGIFLVAVVMVLLPLVYVGLIVASGYLVYLHAVHDTWLLSAKGSGRGKALAVIVYLAPMVAGAILVLFMVKPLFARPAKTGRTRSLTPKGEPLLFAFVDRLCAIVRAPAPQRIDVDCQVNASAGFRRGLLSMFGNDLVLTIGLPLVAGLNLRQFAGVLAHEFGHFSQGVGMRLSFLVRSINLWFARVVYERDEWDERLKNWAESLDSRIGVVLHLARFCVWLTRKVLWVLMMLGHAVSGFMMRQMEYDADRYEARLGGSDTFEATARRLMVLNVATQGAHADLGEFYSEGRLGDDLPRLITVNVDQIPADVRQKIDEAVDQSTTGLFDTHPSDKDRIAAARREEAPGLFRLERPAAVLFADFDGLSKNVTWDYYREVFGTEFKPTDMHSLDDLLARQCREQEAGKAMARWFQGSFHVLRPLGMPAAIDSAPADPREAMASLKQARQRMIELCPAHEEVYKVFDQADTEGLEAEQASALLRAKFKIKPGVFSVSLASSDEVGRIRQLVEVRQRETTPTLGKLEHAAVERLTAALGLLHVSQVGAKLPKAAAWQAEIAAILPALRIVNDQLGDMLCLRNAHAALAILLENFEGHEQDADLVAAIRERMESVRQQLVKIRAALDNVPYPFDHAKGKISIGEYAVATVAAADDLGAIMGGAGELLEKMFALYARLVGHLAVIAEEVERVLGLAPLPEPAEKPAANVA